MVSNALWLKRFNARVIERSRMFNFSCRTISLTICLEVLILDIDAKWVLPLVTSGRPHFVAGARRGSPTRVTHF